MTPSTPLPTLLRYWPVGLWYAVILAVSSVSGRRLDDVGLEINDKLVHAFEYGVLGFLLVLRLPGARRRGWPVVLAIAVLVTAVLGGLDETYQRLIPHRTPSIADWVADVTGGFVGAGLARLWLARNPDRTAPRSRGIE